MACIDLQLRRVDDLKSYRLPLLDGRNRLMAMQRVGILNEERLATVLAQATILWWDEVVDFVGSRHLDADEYADLVAAMLKANPARSDRAIAKLMYSSLTPAVKAQAKLDARQAKRRGRRTRARVRASDPEPDLPTLDPDPDPTQTRH